MSSSAREIGQRKQLFFDDWLIEENHGWRRRMHQAQRHASNPILVDDRPWESAYLCPTIVLYDEEERVYKMWYDGVFRDGRELHDCYYAVSTNGLHWDKPELGLIEWQGSKANNFVYSYPCFKDVHEQNPARRYKQFAGWPVGAQFSPDGFHWTPYEGNPIFPETGDSHTCMGWDSERGRYLGFMRPAGEVRTIALTESEDFEHWSEPRLILAPDQNDRRGIEFYSVVVTKYEGVYVGLLSIYYNFTNLRNESPQGIDQKCDGQLVYSRDGEHWLRMGEREPILPMGPPGGWEDGSTWLYSTLAMGDELWIYYCGTNILHTILDIKRTGQIVDGRRKVGFIGIATLRRDGYVSMRASEWETQLTTHPLIFAGRQLTLNAAVPAQVVGGVRVQLLDESERLVSVNGQQESDAFCGDSLCHVVTWGSSSDLGALTGKPLRIRFRGRMTDLYALQFTN